MQKKFFYLAFSLAAIFIFLSVSLTALAACQKPKAADISMQVTWPASPLSGYSLNEPDPTMPKLVKYFFEWGVGLGGLGVFIALVIAGVQYITSVADPGKVKDAKDRIKSSLIGLVLLLSSWAIFNLINPSLNSMQNLPDISKNIINGKYYTSTECTINYDCCKIAECDPATDCAALTGGASNPNCCVDFNCAPENWLCCRRNDTNCLNKKNISYAALPAPGVKAEGEDCSWSGECQSLNCECDQTDWTTRCMANPQICIQTFGQQTLGCDYVMLFNAPDFPDPVPGNFLKIDSNNTYSPWREPGWAVRSYAAYKYARNLNGSKYIDNNGNETDDITQARVVNCGNGACGCKISLCQFQAASSGQCSDGGTEYAWAFESNVGQDFKSVIINDDTKGATGAINAAKSGVINWAKGLLGY